MSETALLIKTIKRLLKARNLTYADVAVKLSLSEPSVKRLFASGQMTLERLEQLSHILGYTLAELTREASCNQQKIEQLSDSQEKELVSDIKLLLVAVCALNQWTLTQIIEHYQVSEQECVKYLLQLDRLRIIDLLPGNRIRLNISRNFDWRPMGPIRRYFQQRAQDDFLHYPFEQNHETLAFVYGMLTEPALLQLNEELKRLRQIVAQLHENSLHAPLEQRRGMGLLLASRTWEPAGFTELRRKP